LQYFYIELGMPVGGGGVHGRCPVLASISVPRYTVARWHILRPNKSKTVSIIIICLVTFASWNKKRNY